MGLGGADDPLGALEAERGAILKEGGLVALGVFLDRLLAGHGRTDDLVLHVGNVHDVVEFESASAEPAAEDVLEGEGPQVADVDVVIDGGPAGLHADGASIGGGEVFDLLGQGVIEAQGHTGFGSYIHGSRSGE